MMTLALTLNRQSPILTILIIIIAMPHANLAKIFIMARKNLLLFELENFASNPVYCENFECDFFYSRRDLYFGRRLSCCALIFFWD
jgi:hypothetical protein